jgi:hypothetical protein
MQPIPYPIATGWRGNEIAVSIVAGLILLSEVGKICHF